MPYVSGLKIAEHVYQEKPDITVVLMSAYRDFDYARQAIKYNVNRYILKPIDEEELENTFREIKKDLVKRYENTLEFNNINDKIIGMIESYINNNLCNVTLCQLATYVELSPNYLSRFFKEKTGVNLSEFINRKKMEKAKALLKDHRLLVYQVGYDLGYTDYRNFSRAFKNYCGKSPKEYRESCG
jgi:YesN/AraC family two-component response regulator